MINIFALFLKKRNFTTKKIKVKWSGNNEPSFFQKTSDTPLNFLNFGMALNYSGRK